MLLLKYFIFSTVLRLYMVLTDGFRCITADLFNIKQVLHKFSKCSIMRGTDSWRLVTVNNAIPVQFLGYAFL